MRLYLFPLILLFVAGVTSDCFAQAQQSEVAALQARAAKLEQQIADLQKELDDVRDKIAELNPHPLTPYEALAAFERHPERPVTVEFGVERIGYPDGLIKDGDDLEPAIIATWDNFFPGGGTLTAIVPPSVYRQLTLPTKDGRTVKLTRGNERQQVVKHIEANGIRVTGIMQRGGFSDNDYTIQVEKPEDVVLYIKP